MDGRGELDDARIYHLNRISTGGAAEYAARLSDALRDAGLDSRLVFEDQAAGGGPVRTAAGGFVDRVLARCLRSVSRANFHLPVKYSGTPLDVDFRPGDVVHLHGVTNWLDLRKLARRIPSTVAVFWTLHDIWPLTGGCVIYRGCRGFEGSCGGCPALAPPFKSLLGRAGLKVKADLWRRARIQPIANSRWTAAIAEAARVCQGREVPVVYPIVDSAFRRTISRGEARADLGLPPGETVVALGARALTDPVKGIGRFLHRYADRSATRGMVRVLLFGEGRIELPPGMKHHCLGAVRDRAEMAKIYAASDLFVSPSSMETFGMSLVEAQVCGTPVVCYRVGGTPEAVAAGRTGTLVDGMDADQMVKAVDELVADRARREKYAGASRAWANDRFSEKAAVARQMEIYRDGWRERS